VCSSTSCGTLRDLVFDFVRDAARSGLRRCDERRDLSMSFLHHVRALRRRSVLFDFARDAARAGLRRCDERRDLFMSFLHHVRACHAAVRSSTLCGTLRDLACAVVTNGATSSFRLCT
jgi:hypothetical protein